MTTPRDEIFVPASAAVIRDDFLTDFRLEAKKQPGIDDDWVDRAVLPGGDEYILGTALGNMGMLQYSNIRINDDNSDVMTSTGKTLDDKRRALGLPVVPGIGASGRLLVSVSPPGATVTVSDGQEFVLPNGKRGQVDGTHLGVAAFDEVAVFMIDIGEDTNLGYPERVTWVSPPTGLNEIAIVSANSPLTGGTDSESDDRKRERILNRLQNVPAGGSWGHKIEIALNALVTLQMVFVYPALGGPGSEKIAIARAIDTKNGVLTRSMNAFAAELVRNAIHDEFPALAESVVASVVDENVDVAITVTIPDAPSAGGNGLGWLDNAPWPPLAADTEVKVTVATSSQVFTVGALTTTAPVAGQVHIAWWSPADQKFFIGLVTAQSGATTAWVLTLDQGLVDSTGTAPAVGDYISPVAVSMADYGVTWLESFNALGPAENTTSSDRLPRAKRHPLIGESWPSDLTVKQLTDLSLAHPEISDAAWSSRSLTTPTVPGSVATAPNILVSQHFGIYKQ